MNEFRWLVIPAVVGMVAACGGSKASDSSGQNVPADDGGVDAVASPDDGGAEAMAVPPDDGPWPAAHYPLPQFTNLGGKVLASPKVITVTFKGNANRDALRAFDDQLAQASPWWNAVTAGYGVGPGQGGVYVELPDTVSNTTIDDAAQLGPMLQGWVTSGAFPTPDANSIYVIYFPSSTTLTLQGTQSCSAFGAYHNSANLMLEGGLLDTAYAVIPDCGGGMAEATADTSHELSEAVTDPHPQQAPAWYGFNDAWFTTFGSTTGGGQGEVADVCQRFHTVTDASGNVLSKSWVNQAAAASHDPCQPTPPGEIYYGAAVPTQTAPSPAGGKSDGYILMKAGDTKTLDVVVFSEAKLPNDLQLTVGKRQHGVSGLGAIGTGVTATLTPTAGHNGVHVALTLQVAAGTAPASLSAIVRSTLNANDSHDWPFILKIQ